MLKKLTATGIVAAAAAGVMLLGGTANADPLGRPAHRSTSYHPGHRYGHHRHHWSGWGRWHHRNRHRHHRFHFHY